RLGRLWLLGLLGFPGLLGFAGLFGLLGFAGLFGLLGFLGRRRDGRLRLVLCPLRLFPNGRWNLDDGGGSAGRLDLPARLRRKPVRMDGQPAVEVASAEDLDASPDGLDDACLQQGFRKDVGAILEAVQAGQVEDGKALAPFVVKAPQLRGAHRQAGLAALERFRQIHRRAGSLAFLAARRCLAVAGARTATDPLAGVMRARRRLDLVKFHGVSSTLTRWRTL